MKKSEYSTQEVSQKLIGEIISAVKSVRSYGSVEIYVQDGFVTQLTIRNIKKTSSRKDR